MRTNTTYAVFWEPPGSTVASGYNQQITQFLQDVAAANGSSTNVFSVTKQYSDTTGPIASKSTFAGSYVETAPFPASGCHYASSIHISTCLTEAQIETELSSVVSSRGLPRGTNHLYLLFLPENVGGCHNAWSKNPSSCGNGDWALTQSCGWHDVLVYNSPRSRTPDAVLPYGASNAAGLPANGCAGHGLQSPNSNDADATINALSHEMSEAITDPLGTAWYGGSVPGSGEIGDLCTWKFLTAQGGTPGHKYNQVINGHNYWLQSEWSNATHSCLLGWVRGTPSITTTTLTGATAGIPYNGTVSGKGGAFPYRWSIASGSLPPGLALSPVTGAITGSPVSSGSSTATIRLTDAAKKTAQRTFTIHVGGASSAGHVYWLSSGSMVKRVSLGGGGVTTLASGQGGPDSLAVDSTRVYWTNENDGTVRSVPLGGGPVTTLASGPGALMSVATDGTNVYWADEALGTVGEVPVGGGSVTALASGQNGPFSVAVSGGYVYWVNIGHDGQADGTVNKAPIGGGSVTTLATGQESPVSVTVDGTNVYWINDNGLSDANPTVREAPVGGGSVTTLATGQTGAVSIAVGGGYVYWVNGQTGQGTEAVKRAPIRGGSVTTLASGASWYSLAVDNTYLYFSSAGTLRKVPLAGGSVATIPTDQPVNGQLVIGP